MKYETRQIYETYKSAWILGLVLFLFFCFLAFINLGAVTKGDWSWFSLFVGLAGLSLNFAFFFMLFARISEMFAAQTYDLVNAERERAKAQAEARTRESSELVEGFKTALRELDAERSSSARRAKTSDETTSGRNWTTKIYCHTCNSYREVLASESSDRSYASAECPVCRSSLRQNL